MQPVTKNLQVISMLKLFNILHCNIILQKTQSNTAQRNFFQLSIKENKGFSRVVVIILQGELPSEKSGEFNFLFDCKVSYVKEIVQFILQKPKIFKTIFLFDVCFLTPTLIQTMNLKKVSLYICIFFYYVLFHRITSAREFNEIDSLLYNINKNGQNFCLAQRQIELSLQLFSYRRKFLSKFYHLNFDMTLEQYVPHKSDFWETCQTYSLTRH